jgi:Mg/Co/Ni transporter MgtE
MKFHQDGKGFTLESAGEVAEFQKIVDIAWGLKKVQKERAQRVFDAFVSGNEEVDIDDLSRSEAEAIHEWADKMSAAILNDLDHRSIGEFVELILVSHQRASQAAKAHKRHTENHAMKAEVFTWLDANMTKFRSMEKAAETISRTVAPVAVRTARVWVSDWKKLRTDGASKNGGHDE